MTRPIYCRNCSWEGSSDDLILSLVPSDTNRYGIAWVCPNCEASKPLSERIDYN